jgi:hypothetical protein
MSQDLVQSFSHSVKIEQTVKGARITVHVNANDSNVAMKEAISLYQNTKMQMKSLGEEVAPIEVTKKEAIS